MPSSSAAPAVEPRLRRARAAVSAVFFLNAVLYANLVPRLPDIKDRLDLSNAALGSAIAAMPLGALLAGLLAPVLIQRLGSAKVAALGLVVLAVAVAGLPLAPAWIVFAALMLVVGALDAVVDVAQNAHGFRVQRAYGRSIVNAFHALWSIGAVVGGLLGSAAAGLSVPLGVHLAASAAVFSVLAVVAYRFLLPGPEDAERTSPVDIEPDPAAPRRRLLGHVSGRTLVLLGVLGLLASCEAFVQDAGSTWGALYMRGEVGAGAAVGGLAFVALQVAMTAGRLVGDRVVDRFGQRRVVRVGGVVTAAGMGLALAVPSVGTAIVGFALAGLGVATLVPAVMHTADELPGLPHGVGLTVVTWLLRVGFLVSPSVIGIVADASSLRVALVGVVLAGVVVLLLGRVLAPTHTPEPEAGAGDVITPGTPAAAPGTTQP
ncbi:MFS transporter [Geodermatophilus sp. YIM 151500]|uniref:MFS transporter n=1 Tax=Geodermatophilus sp. YIM 151500 TaxID=2984531 RepID=UPI0021E3930A|nr:MFS transporter [Geodermatophilus sp. YIM 151500]MCV2490961.1 MFS transporter [Geodermatophilus sp. YIM 151500]